MLQIYREPTEPSAPHGPDSAAASPCECLLLPLLVTTRSGPMMSMPLSRKAQGTSSNCQAGGHHSAPGGMVVITFQMWWDGGYTLSLRTRTGKARAGCLPPGAPTRRPRFQPQISRPYPTPDTSLFGRRHRNISSYPAGLEKKRKRMRKSHNGLLLPTLSLFLGPCLTRDRESGSFGGAVVGKIPRRLQSPGLLIVVKQPTCVCDVGKPLGTPCGAA